MSAQSGSTIFSFGRFQLVLNERSLTTDGTRLELGARTFDTLIALVSRPNEVLSKRELLASIWPDVTVDEGSLRFQIAALRRALGDGNDGARYIETLAGRGYCFVAPVSRSDEEMHISPAAETNEAGVAFLPARLARLVGRSEDIDALATELTRSRFVTIVGSGGVGKTTTAVAVAHRLLKHFSGAVAFVDLSTLSDPALVAPYLASILGLSVQSDDATPILTSYLCDKRLLLVLDSCEHLIEATARLAASLFAAAPQIHILATSREALLVDNECVHRLPPLALPPEVAGLTTAIALAFPATRLFIERAVANDALADLSDSDAPIVANICRKLDGVPLAIELAAGRVATAL